MRAADLIALGERLAERTKQYFADEMRPFLARVDSLAQRIATLEGGGVKGFTGSIDFEAARALEQRVADLEARPTMQFKGYWDCDTAYEAGDCVSRGGSMWIAKSANIGVNPGGAPQWALCVKRGRDGREGERDIGR
jgi:hypothetical protein